jgi:hypothetical protein
LMVPSTLFMLKPPISSDATRARARAYLSGSVCNRTQMSLSADGPREINRLGEVV